MSVNHYSQQIELVDHELIAKADMQFTFSVSLKNDKPLCLDMSFTSLKLKSEFNSVVLVECTSSTQSIPVLRLNVLISDEGENQLHFTLPCINLWLFLSDWSKVVDVFSSSCLQLPKTATFNEELKKSNLDELDRVKNPENASPNTTVSSYLASEDIIQHPLLLTVKSDHIGVRICVPVQVSGEAFRYFGSPHLREQDSFDDYSFLFINMQSRCTEMDINGQKAILKSNFGKTTGTVELCQNKRVHSWPLFQLLQIDVEADVGNDELDHMHLNADVHCDDLDIWLSHDIFYFWQTMIFVFPDDSGSSQPPVFGVNFRFHLGKLSILLTDQKVCSYMFDSFMHNSTFRT